MTQEQYRRAARDVICLAGCAARGETPELSKIEDVQAAYSFASRHMLTAAAAYALESAGQRDESSRRTIARSIRRAALFEQAYGEVKARLQAAGIWFLPLKGAVLKEYYPKPGMREMADYDILFDAGRAEDVRTIMEGLGFEAKDFGSDDHDCYYKAPILNFEMHRVLFASHHGKELSEYYADVQKRLIGDGCEKRFSPEDTYLYILAHEYKHYSNNGTGLRSLLDTYVYLSAEKLDMDYVGAEAEKLGLRDFEEKNRSLAMHLFGEEPLTDADRRMLDYILMSGTYGTMTHGVANKLKRKKWSKLRYMLDRFFVPVSRKNREYADYEEKYPFFYKYKIFLPLLPFYRVFRAVIGGRFRAEAAAIREAGKGTAAD